jgi:hypothetical protein
MKTQNMRYAFRIQIAIGLVSFMLLTPILSMGWGAGGHMMVAKIALDRLNPRAKAQAQMLLAMPINPAGISSKSKDFVNAAHWADDLRPVAEFDSFQRASLPRHALCHRRDGVARTTDTQHRHGIGRARKHP